MAKEREFEVVRYTEDGHRPVLREVKAEKGEDKMTLKERWGKGKGKIKKAGKYILAACGGAAATGGAFLLHGALNSKRASDDDAPVPEPEEKTDAFETGTF